MVLADVPLYRNFLKNVFLAVLAWQKAAMTFDVPGPKNWNEGTLAKTALLQNLPFVSSRSVNDGFETVVRVLWGNEAPLPPFYLNATLFSSSLGGSLVGVWNGWGYGIAFFWALNF